MQYLGARDFITTCIYLTGPKKFSEGKQAHVLEPSKTNQTRWEWHHTPFLLYHFANYAHHKTLNMQLAY